MAGIQGSPKDKFNPNGCIEDLLQGINGGAARIEKLFEYFGDPKEERLASNIRVYPENKPSRRL